jgi:hypothetical protein
VCGARSWRFIFTERHFELLIPLTVPAEQFLADASPEAISNARSASSTPIGLIAASFGPRSEQFSLIEEYALADNFGLHDRALFCADGDLVADSSVCDSPGVHHRASPWFRVGALRLHSVEAAKERYRDYAKSSGMGSVLAGSRSGIPTPASLRKSSSRTRTR